MIILGVDPGASGGIAGIHEKIGGAAWALKDKTLMDQWKLFMDHRKSSELNSTSIKAYLESVHSMPRDGVRSAFSFGKSYGNLEAFLVAAEIPFERVTPSVWQKEFGLIKRKGETHTQKKNRHKALAQEMFPSVKVTHATADAILLAEYGRRQK